MKRAGIEIIVDTIVENNTVHQLLSLSNIFENGSWKQENIEHFIGNHLPEAALSAKERNALIGEPFSILQQSKINLRQSTSTSKAEGSELAEIFLYGIMKKHYSALPLVPKIFYKQNSRDYAKGADSVHLVIENNDFSIWLGECKFYNGLSDAFKPALVSVKELLNTTKLHKENSIISNLQELDNLQSKNPQLTDEIKNKIRSFMEDSKRSIDTFKPKLHVPIFIMHECGITSSATEFSNNYKNQLVDVHNKEATDFFNKKVNELSTIHKIESIHFHLILLPIPDKSKLVDWYQNSFLGVK
jgi:hypothetical protein